MLLVSRWQMRQARSSAPRSGLAKLPDRISRNPHPDLSIRRYAPKGVRDTKDVTSLKPSTRSKPGIAT